MTIGNHKQNVVVIWWEAVGRVKREQRALQLAVRRQDIRGCIESLQIFCEAMDTWLGCQDRWKKRQVNKEQLAIIELYLALDVPATKTYRILDKIYASNDIQWSNIKLELLDIYEFIKIAGSLPSISFSE